MKITTALLLLFALDSVNLHAKSMGSKIPILVNCTIEPEDFIGQRLCSALRDDIARSPRYYEVIGGASVASYFLALHVASLTADSSRTSSQAVALTVHLGEGAPRLGATPQQFVALWAYITVESGVKAQAETILAAVDTQVQELIGAIRNPTIFGFTR